MPARKVVVDNLLWQFDLVWTLAELHFVNLVEDDCLWQPSPISWTVRRDAAGLWRPDFAEVEPDPVPTPTIGWLMWHIDWWWSSAVNQLRGRPPPAREHITWPGQGNAAITHLRQLSDNWRTLVAQLDDDDLHRPSSFPWHPDTGHTVTHTAMWVNVELTKNITEIGQLRLTRAAITAAGAGT